MMASTTKAVHSAYYPTWSWLAVRMPEAATAIRSCRFSLSTAVREVREGVGGTSGAEAAFT